MKPKTKSCANLYSRIWQPFNLWQAYKAAAKGKRTQTAAAAFEFNLEEELIRLEEELRDGTYYPGGYHHFIINKPKRRLISAAPFRDRVVHHALMHVIEPFFERQFIYDSYANRVGKGTHRALDRCTFFMRRFRYVMHLDVVQFFPSIDHQILRSILGRTLMDPEILGFIDKILSNGESIQSEEYDMIYFPGDDLFAAIRRRGLPIGNLTSQHWANVYLNNLDQFVKRELKFRGYLRYVDDILLFADSKSDLNESRKEIIKFLQELRLTLHERRARSRPVETGIPFLGFIVFPDHRRLKRRNGIAYRKRLNGLAQCVRNGELGYNELHASLIGWINHVGYGDTWGLRKAILSSARLGME